MLDQTFLELLEYQLTKAFSMSQNKELKGFWCDGILLPTFENEYSKKHINDHRQILTKAFLGTTGQDKYELTMKFGKKSLSKYARDLDILECIPNPEKSNWFNVDIPAKKIIVQLL